MTAAHTLEPGGQNGSRQRSADEIRFTISPCSLGQLLVAQSARGVSAVLFGDDAGELGRDLARRFPGAALIAGEPGHDSLAMKVVALVESPVRELDVPLDTRGTEFQRRVWQALRQIPAGSTASYSDIARRLGMPKSARAVAQACAANALAVVVPCHRAVRSDGSLSGYRWGVERKRALLEREARE